MKLFTFFKGKYGTPKNPPKSKPLNKQELEKKVTEGAQKAVREYRRVFERLAEYDRT